jgi:hypothetical protein
MAEGTPGGDGEPGRQPEPSPRPARIPAGPRGDLPVPADWLREELLRRPGGRFG